jgi:hypothetical protein
MPDDIKVRLTAEEVFAEAEALGVLFDVEEDGLHVFMPKTWPLERQQRVARMIGENPLLHAALDGEPSAVRWFLDRREPRQ